MKTKIIIPCMMLIMVMSFQSVDAQVENIKLYENGTVLISEIGTFFGRNMEISTEQYSPYLLGVYFDENPEVMQDPRKYIIPVKTKGMSFVKFSDVNGDVKKGDPVTSSDIPGVAMKATESGMILGVALEDANSSQLLKIRVMVQYMR